MCGLADRRLRCIIAGLSIVGGDCTLGSGGFLGCRAVLDGGLGDIRVNGEGKGQSPAEDDGGREMT